MSRLQPLAKFCSQNSPKWKAMSQSHLETCIYWTSVNSWFKDFLSNLLLKLIIYCVIDQPVLNFKFSFFAFLRLLSWPMSIEQIHCYGKIFQLQSFPNFMICIEKKFAVKNSGVSCLASILDLSNPNMKILHCGCTWKIGSRLQDMTSHILCFLGWWIQTSGLVAKASCSESGYTALSIIVLLQFRQICLYWQVFNS